MRVKLISCEVFYREICLAVSRSPNQVDIEFLPKGLHDIGSTAMRERVQAVLDRVAPECYEAVLFGYGLCNNGLAGLTAGRVPLVLPRAHDCITLFLGSKERYLEYFHANPGVYFKTTGWIERGGNSGELTQLSIPRRTGMDYQYEELVAKYGEENARYLYETLCNHTRHYSQFTFIEMGVEPDDSFEQQTRAQAAERGWKFEKVAGDLTMIQRLVDGPWDDGELLMVPPGHRVVTTYDPSIVAAERTPEASR
jgi:hypothetical protein